MGKDLESELEMPTDDKPEESILITIIHDEEMADAQPAWGFPVKLDASGSDLEEYIARHREWSYKTFGPGSRAEGLLKHIRKELLEIEADPGDLMEWVDVMILAIDGAWRAGFSPFEVAEALKRKQEVNFRRKWPDWRKAKDGEPIEHEKEKPPQRDGL